MALVSSCAGDPVSGAPWLVQSLFLRHWLPVFAENSSRQEPRVIPLRSMIIYLLDFPTPVLYENPLPTTTSFLSLEEKHKRVLYIGMPSWHCQLLNTTQYLVLSADITYHFIQIKFL